MTAEEIFMDVNIVLYFAEYVKNTLPNFSRTIFFFANELTPPFPTIQGKKKISKV